MLTTTVTAGCHNYTSSVVANQHLLYLLSWCNSLVLNGVLIVVWSWVGEVEVLVYKVAYEKTEV